MGLSDWFSKKQAETPHKTEQGAEQRVGWLRRRLANLGIGKNPPVREALPPANSFEAPVQAITGGDPLEMTDDQANRLVNFLVRRDSMREDGRRAAVYRKDPYQVEPLAIDLDQAESLFDKNFLGPKQLEKAFGFRAKNIPPIPFSQTRLERAQKDGFMLVLHVDKTPDGKPMTMRHMNEIQAKSKRKKKVLYSTDWYEDESFFTDESPRLGWRLVFKSIIPSSTDKNEVQQMELIVETLKGMGMQEAYQEAIDEFESQKDEITKFMEGKDEFMKKDDQWKEASKMIEALKLSKLTRATPAEMIQTIETHHQNTGEYLFGNTYVRTRRRDSSGLLVNVGRADAAGVSVRSFHPGLRSGSIGVSLSLQS